VVCHDPKDREDILLKILKEGLPVDNSNPCTGHIIIVGAGISGLTAGKLFKDAGFKVEVSNFLMRLKVNDHKLIFNKVTILESTDRVGGRIQTYR